MTGSEYGRPNLRRVSDVLAGLRRDKEEEGNAVIMTKNIIQKQIVGGVFITTPTAKR